MDEERRRYGVQGRWGQGATPACTRYTVTTRKFMKGIVGRWTMVVCEGEQREYASMRKEESCKGRRKDRRDGRTSRIDHAYTDRPEIETAAEVKSVRKKRPFMSCILKRVSTCNRRAVGGRVRNDR